MVKQMFLGKMLSLKSKLNTGAEQETANVKNGNACPHTDITVQNFIGNKATSSDNNTDNITKVVIVHKLTGFLRKKRERAPTSGIFPKSGSRITRRTPCSYSYMCPSTYRERERDTSH